MNTNFTHAVCDFKMYMQIRGYKPATIHYYHLATYECLEYLSENKKLSELSDITPSHLYEYYHNYLTSRSKLLGSGALSEQTLSNYIKGLRLFFSYALLSQLIDRDPISGLSFPKGVSKEATVLSEEEVRSIFDVAEDEFSKVALHLVYSCGLRRNEAVQLKDSEIDLEERILFVSNGKNSKQRYVPFHRLVATDFSLYLKVRHRVAGEDCFLVNKQGKSLRGDELNDLVKKLGKKAGISQNIYLHCFRHSISTHLQNRGMDSDSVREFLGHESLDTTLYYLHQNRLKIRW